jgi:hypothetical protein
VGTTDGGKPNRARDFTSDIDIRDGKLSQRTFTISTTGAIHKGK